MFLLSTLISYMGLFQALKKQLHLRQPILYYWPQYSGLGVDIRAKLHTGLQSRANVMLLNAVSINFRLSVKIWMTWYKYKFRMDNMSGHRTDSASTLLPTFRLLRPLQPLSILPDIFIQLALIDSLNGRNYVGSN